MSRSGLRENVWGGPATGFDCYTSNDLDHWDGPTEAFRPPPGFWADTQYWAPEVHVIDGRFFMLATFATSTGARPRGVAVLVSDRATGPYEPWSDGPVTPANEPCLDGTLHIDDDSTRWLVYSRGSEGTSDRVGIADGEMYALRLSEDLRGGVGEPILLFAANGGHGMVLRTSSGRDCLAFHWPNNTPDERVQLKEVEIKGNSVKIL